MKLKQFFLLLTVVFFSSCSFFTQEETEDQKGIDTLQFEQSSLTLFRTEQKSIKVKVSPEKKVVKTFSLSKQGIVTIDSKTDDGVVITAQSYGEVTLIVKADGKTAYLPITVQDGSLVEHPYIVTDSLYQNFIVGQKKNITASLYGGTESDNEGFIYTSSNPAIIKVESTLNVGVFEALKEGHVEVVISHPKSKYTKKIICYSGNNGTMIPFISTQTPVVYFTDKNEIKRVELDLIGISHSSEAYVWNVIEGYNNIQVTNTSNIIEIKSLQEGVARIEITHPLCVYPLEILIFIKPSLNQDRIISSTDFVMCENDASEIVVFYEKDGTTSLQNFTFSLDTTEYVDVSQLNNSLLFKGIKSGTTQITVTDAKGNTKEILCFVNKEKNIQDYNNRYIQAKSSYIELEVGDKNIPFDIQLVGGEEGDKNNFTWEVEDGSIIEAYTSYGAVTYKARSVYSVLNAQAFINTKKSGITKINVSHPKSKNITSIMVVVYPKGTLNKGLYSVYFPDSALFIKEGEEKVFNLSIAGSSLYTSEIEWELENDVHVVINGSNKGSSVTIKGIKEGFVKLRITGEHCKQKYEKYIFCTNTSNEITQAYLYVSEPIISLSLNQTYYTEIQSSNNSVTGSYAIEMNYSQKDILFQMLGNVLYVKAFREGTYSAKVVNSVFENEVDILVEVKNTAFSLEYPYTIESDNYYIGINELKGAIPLNITNAPDNEYENIAVETDFEGTLYVENKNLYIIGSTGTEGYVYLSHPKCKNKKRIYIKIVESENQKTSFYPLFTELNHIVLQKGETHIAVIQTLGIKEKDELIQWSFSSLEFLSVIAENTLVRVEAKKIGTTVVSIAHPQGNTIKIVVDVLESSKDKNIILETFHELRINEKKVIPFTIIGYSEQDKNVIIESDGISSVLLKDSLVIEGLTEGFFPITLSLSDGYKKTIYCNVTSDNQTNIQNFLYSDVTYRKINTGEQIFIPIQYTNTNITEFQYEVENKSLVSISQGINGFYINALDIGNTYIVIKSPQAENQIKIYIEINSLSQSSEYTILVDSLIKIKKGTTKSLILETVNSENTVLENSQYESVLSYGSNAVSVLGNTLKIVADETGIFTLYIKDTKNVAEKKCVVTIVESDAEINTPLIYANKTFFKDTVNSELNLILNYENGIDVSKITWSFPSISDCYYENINNINIKVKGLNVGTYYFTAQYEGQKIVYTVSFQKDIGDVIQLAAFMTVSQGEVKKLPLITNIDCMVLDVAMSDTETVSIVQETSDIKVYGKKQGYSIVSLKKGSLERSILIYCGTDESFKKASCFVSGNSSIHISVGEKVVLPLSTNKIDFDYSLLSLKKKSGGGSIATTSYTSYVALLGVEEGYAEYELSHPYSEVIQTITIFIEQGNIEEQSYVYLETEKLFHLVSLENNTYTLSAYLSNYEQGMYTWENHSSDIYDITVAGSLCSIKPKKKGIGYLSLTSPQALNSLYFTIEINDEYSDINNGIPYLYVEKNVFFIESLDEVLTIPVELRNTVSASSVSVEQTDSLVSSYKVFENVNGIDLIITPLTRGETTFTITHPDSRNTLTIVCNVNPDKTDTKSIYLSTSQNVIVIKKGELKQVYATLYNYTETNTKNFIWNIANPELVYTIGEGLNIQLYGVSVGSTEITLSHPFSLNKLTFKVLIEDSAIQSEIPYLTTNKNVVETYLQDSLLSLNVQLYGSYEKDKIKWTNDNPDVITMTSAIGESCYYKTNKAGLASVTVSHPACPYSFSFSIIVSDMTESIYRIETKQKLYMVSPFTEKIPLSVSLINGTDKDAESFNWTVLSQELSSQGDGYTSGSVISIVSNGSICYVNTFNEGKATIRVTHPKSNDKIDIQVYITETGVVSFEKDSITAIVDDIQFVSIVVPTYNSLRPEVLYSIDDTSIASVYGNSEVCVIQAKKAGKAIIKASLESGDTDEFVLTVENSNVINTKELRVSKTSLILNPRSSSETLSACLYGAGVNDTMNDSIKWTINDANKVLTVYPASLEGREIQVTPSGKVGLATITVSHSLTSLNKTILVQVSEISNFFTLDKSLETLEKGYSTSIKATIAQGKVSDYENIIWKSSRKLLYDGTYKDVVRIIGTGQRISVLALESGTSTISAFYKGVVTECVITVEEPYIFTFNNKSVTVRPGLNYPVEVGYTVKPSDAIINFTKTDSLESNDSYSYAVDQVRKVVIITGNKEGSGTITGKNNIKYDTLNINVKNTYSLTTSLLSSSLSMNYDSTQKVEIPFKVDPPDTAIDVELGKVKIRNVEYDASQAFTMSVTSPDKTTGQGKVIITGSREFIKGSLPSLVIKQYKDQTMKEATGKTLSFFISGAYSDKKSFISYFIKHSGRYSNTSKNYAKYHKYDVESKQKYYIGNSPSIVSVDNYSAFSEDDKISESNGIYLYDGETSYILIKDSLALSENEISNIYLSTSLNGYTANLVTLQDGTQAVSLVSENDIQDINRVVFENLYGYEYEKTEYDEKKFTVCDDMFFDKEDIHVNLSHTGRIGGFNELKSELMWKSEGYNISKTTESILYENGLTLKNYFSGIKRLYHSFRIYNYGETNQTMEHARPSQPNKPMWGIEYDKLNLLVDIYPTVSLDYENKFNFIDFNTIYKAPIIKYNLNKTKYYPKTKKEPSLDYYNNNYFKHKNNYDIFKEGTQQFTKENYYEYPNNYQFNINYKVSGGYERVSNKTAMIYDGENYYSNIDLKKGYSYWFVYYRENIRSNAVETDKTFTKSFNTNGAGQKNAGSNSNYHTYNSHRVGLNEKITISKVPYLVNGKKQFEDKNKYFGKGYKFENQLKEGIDFNFYPTNSLIPSSSVNGTLTLIYKRYNNETGTIVIPVTERILLTNKNYDYNNSYVTSFYK